jgi:hypothetical protein
MKHKTREARDIAEARWMVRHLHKTAAQERGKIGGPVFEQLGEEYLVVRRIELFDTRAEEYERLQVQWTLELERLTK